MVFHVLHGVDEKDPSTVTTPFAFDRALRMDRVRIGVDANAPRELVEQLRELGMQPREIGARPTVPGMNSALGVEGAAAFDAYVQRKAKETGLDLNALPERPPTPPVGAATAPPTHPMAPADWNPRFVNGRTARGFDFLQTQRRRYELITRWAEFMKELDMFIGNSFADVGANAQTGHPCVVFPYKFDVPQPPNFGGRAAPDTARTAPPLEPQPICATIVGALYQDDQILGVAHQFQASTEVHLRHPAM